MRTILFGALLATAAATPAFAQDVADAPFTGPHIEVVGGYDRLGNTGDDSRDGFLYGVALGYDVQVGGAIAGIEAEATDSTTTLSESSVLANGDRFDTDTDRDLYIGARLGVVAGKTLIYAKGGYTNARVETNYKPAGTGTSDTQFATTLDGYRVGAGVEQKFNLFGPSGFVKAEYRYSNYQNADVGNTDADIDLDRHQALVGVGIRF